MTHYVPCPACGGEGRVRLSGWRTAEVPCAPCNGTGDVLPEEAMAMIVESAP